MHNIRGLFLAGAMMLFPFFANADNAFFRTLSVGARGEDVRTLQKLLNDLPETRLTAEGAGSPGYETTYFGPKTKDAVRRFQELHAKEILAPLSLNEGTGIAGKFTKEALGALRLDRREIFVHTPFIFDGAPHSHKEGEPDTPHAKWHANEGLFVVPSDMWITAIVPRIDDASHEILHHATLYKEGGVNPLCPRAESPYREIFSVSLNSATQAVYFPSAYALPLYKGDRLYLEVMTHNPAPPLGPGIKTPQARVGIEMRGIAMERAEKLPLEFVRLKIDDTPCAEPYRHEAFRVASNTPSAVTGDRFFGNATSSASYRFPADGTMVGLGANVWPIKGGRAMHALLNGEKIADIPAVHHDPAIPWAWNIPLKQDFLFSIKKGDIISAEAVYENPHPYDIPDASGMLAFFFAQATTTPSGGSPIH